MRLESGTTVYIGFPQDRPADWLQFPLPGIPSLISAPANRRARDTTIRAWKRSSSAPSSTAPALGKREAGDIPARTLARAGCIPPILNARQHRTHGCAASSLLHFFITGAGCA